MIATARKEARSSERKMNERGGRDVGQRGKVWRVL